MLYNLLALPRRLLSLVLVVLLISVIGAASAVVSSPNGAALFSVIKPGHNFALKPEDFHRAARLTALERQQAVNECVARASSWITLTKSRMRAEAREAATERACDCIVNQVEDRGSKFQFAVAMDAIANAPWSRGRGGIENSTKYRDAAYRSGMTPVDYKRALTETYAVMDAAARTCIDHLRGR